MSKKEKKNQCENHEQEMNKECTCQHDEHCCKHNEEEKQCECKDKNLDENLSQKIEELNDALLRSQAELINYKKRKDEETTKILKYAEKDILEGFLPILDNFERAINMDDNNFGDETSKFLEGFRMVYNQTKVLLEKFGVTEIDCLGKEFDPAVAQAVVVEKDESKESGVVLQVLQKGYMYKDRILRTAMVKVNE